MEDVDDIKAPFGISGKAQRLVDSSNNSIRLGLFGYKTGAFSLQHQIAKALNTDLGVKTSVLPEPDCGENQLIKGQCDNNVALDDQHLTNLVKYIALLGVRAQRNLADLGVIRGEPIFTDIGCNDNYCQYGFVV